MVQSIEISEQILIPILGGSFGINTVLEIDANSIPYPE